MKMLYTQRTALAAMPAPWRPVHRLLWAAYTPVAGLGLARRLWGAYRKTWPEPERSETRPAPAAAMDPCGECPVGTCDDCEFCVWTRSL